MPRGLWLKNSWLKKGQVVLVLTAIFLVACQNQVPTASQPTADDLAAAAKINGKITAAEKMNGQWEGWQLYEGAFFTFRYPQSWGFQEDKTYQSWTIVPPDQSAEEEIRIFLTDFVFEGALREEFIEDWTLKGAKKAQLLHDFAPKDGAPLDRLVVQLDENKFIELNGHGPTFALVIKSFALK